MHEPSDSGSDTPEVQPTPTVSIVSEMRRSFLDYAMSVIVSRAIPDLRDGLKPVHRRILYAMQDGGYLWNRPYRKSARVVGDVIGRYHPHGDTAVYDALVRMAQDFSMRLPLIDGQGNFGSVDGDSPAAMRYTEVRMARAAQDMLADIDKNTVDFQANYDDQDREPVVLPARIPNLLANGAEGIAVGMATRIPPHNLGELVDAALALSRNPELSIDELIQIVPGPDFPTGGLIIGRAGIRNVYHLGQGSIIMRARSEIGQTRGGRAAILIEEIPYQVNKANLVELIAQLARNRQIDGVAEVRDESDRHGMRVVVGLKRDADPEVVRNQLHRRTPLQTAFSANMVTLIRGRPIRFDLKTYLTEFLAFRESVIRRRAAHELTEARDRAHVLCGLAIAVENLDEMVVLIRNAPNPQAAREALRIKQWETGKIKGYLRLIDDPEQQSLIDEPEGRITLSEPQIKAILELRLQRLTGLGRGEIAEELRELGSRIEGLLTLLASQADRRKIVEAELEEVRKAHATPRRTEILEVADEVEDEALIKREKMFVTVTHGGYIMRTAADDYRAQKRGGKGVAGMVTKDEDFVTRLLAADTHTQILLFTSSGIVFKMKVWRLPLGKRTGRGKAIVNLLPVESGVSLSSMLPVRIPEEEWDQLQIVFATSTGKVRRNKLSDFARVHAGGKIAIKLDPEARLAATVLCTPADDLLLTTAGGRSIRFPAREVRLFAGRSSQGVRGMRLAPGDEIVSMSAIPDPGRTETVGVEEPGGGQTLLFVDSVGAGKRVASAGFSTKHRGGGGVIAMTLPKRADGTARRIVYSLQVEETDQIMLATDAGQTIRCPVDDVPFRSRTAGGVRLLRVRPGERVIAVTRIPQTGEEEELPEGEDDGMMADGVLPEDEHHNLPEDLPEEEDHGGSADPESEESPPSDGDAAA